MNELNKDFIRVDHPLRHESGEVYAGFYGQIQKADEELTSIQEEIIRGYEKGGYVVFYGSIKNICDILREYSTTDCSQNVAQTLKNSF